MPKWYQEERHPAATQIIGFPICAEAEDLLDQGFYALLTRSEEIGKELEPILYSRGIELPESGYRLLHVFLDSKAVEALPEEDRYCCRMNVYAALRKFFADTLPKEISGFLSLQPGSLFMQLYLPEEYEAVLCRVCQDAVQYAESLGFPVYVTVSSRWESIREVQRAYAALRDLEACRAFFQETEERILKIPDDVHDRIINQEQRTAFESTFSQTAERICGALQAGEMDAAADFMQEQLARIAENCRGMPWPAAFDNTINRFILQLQYHMSEQKLADWHFLVSSDFSRDLVASGTFSEYLEIGAQIVHRLYAHFQQFSTDQHTQMMRDIRTYIEQKATDVNMGLTAIAQKFHCNPRKISVNFRAYYGEGINDLIHKIRIAQAKELLLTTDETIEAIADRVGYCSLTTMYRAFMAIEGITPGSLRKQAKADIAVFELHPDK